MGISSKLFVAILLGSAILTEAKSINKRQTGEDEDPAPLTTPASKDTGGVNIPFIDEVESLVEDIKDEAESLVDDIKDTVEDVKETIENAIEGSSSSEEKIMEYEEEEEIESTTLIPDADPSENEILLKSAFGPGWTNYFFKPEDIPKALNPVVKTPSTYQYTFNYPGTSPTGGSGFGYVTYNHNIQPYNGITLANRKTQEMPEVIDFAENDEDLADAEVVEPQKIDGQYYGVHPYHYLGQEQKQAINEAASKVHQMPYFYQNSHPQLVNPYTAALNPLGYSRFGPAPLTAFGALKHAQQTGAFKMPHILPSQPYGALTEVKPKEEEAKVEVETVEYDE